MKRREIALVDLHYDILKEILIHIAESSHGAKNFAKAISVCTAFRQFVEDGDVLRAVAFDDLSIIGHWELFQLRGGLICRCAQAGQTQAQFILAKIFLMSTSQLWSAKRDSAQEEASSSGAQASSGNLPEENAHVSSFLENFLPDQTCPHFIGFHFDFVKLFLSRARASEFKEMKHQLKTYMKYFIRCKECNQSLLLSSLEELVVLEGSWEFSANHLRRVYHPVSEWTQILELKAEQVGKIETGAVERKFGFHDSETSDMLHKHVRAMKAVIGEVTRALGCSTRLDPRLAFLKDFSDCARVLKNLGAGLESVIKGCQLAASRIKDKRAYLLSKFESLLSCQILTKHEHELDSRILCMPNFEIPR